MFLPVSMPHGAPSGRRRGCGMPYALCALPSTRQQKPLRVFAVSTQTRSGCMDSLDGGRVQDLAAEGRASWRRISSGRCSSTGRAQLRSNNSAAEGRRRDSDVPPMFSALNAVAKHHSHTALEVISNVVADYLASANANAYNPTNRNPSVQVFSCTPHLPIG